MFKLYRYKQITIFIFNIYKLSLYELLVSHLGFISQFQFFLLKSTIKQMCFFSKISNADYFALKNPDVDFLQWFQELLASIQFVPTAASSTSLSVAYTVPGSALPHPPRLLVTLDKRIHSHFQYNRIQRHTAQFIRYVID